MTKEINIYDLLAKIAKSQDCVEISMDTTTPIDMIVIGALEGETIEDAVGSLEYSISQLENALRVVDFVDHETEITWNEGAHKKT